jgi:hypothetical protein
MTWGLWLDCLTQQQIADEIGIDKATVSRWLDELQNGRAAELQQPPASRQHFDVWSFQAAIRLLSVHWAWFRETERACGPAALPGMLPRRAPESPGNTGGSGRG